MGTLSYSDVQGSWHTVRCDAFSFVDKGAGGYLTMWMHARPLRERTVSPVLEVSIANADRRAWHLFGSSPQDVRCGIDGQRTLAQLELKDRSPGLP